MNNSRLFIIGNGFDLEHCLPTKYSCFRCYMRQLGEEAICCGSELLSARDILNNFLSLCSPDDLWNDFESQTESIISALHNKQYLLFGETHGAHLDIGAEWHKLQDKVASVLMPVFGETVVSDSCEAIRELTNALFNKMVSKDFSWIIGLYRCFQNWVESINITGITPEFSVFSSDYAITFNYTLTLEDVYSLSPDNILHIHGSANSADSIVLGCHSAELDKKLQGLNTIFTPEHKNYQQLKEKYKVGSIGANAFYDNNIGRFYKPVNVLMEKIDGFIDDKMISDVIVIGHSYNEIDQPYFKKIFELLPNAKYQFSYHSEHDKEKIDKMIAGTECKVSYSKICSGLFKNSAEKEK